MTTRNRSVTLLSGFLLLLACDESSQEPYEKAEPDKTKSDQTEATQLGVCDYLAQTEPDAISGCWGEVWKHTGCNGVDLEFLSEEELGSGLFKRHPVSGFYFSDVVPAAAMSPDDIKSGLYTLNPEMDLYFLDHEKIPKEWVKMLSEASIYSADEDWEAEDEDQLGEQGRLDDERVSP